MNLFESRARDSNRRMVFFKFHVNKCYNVNNVNM